MEPLNISSTYTRKKAISLASFNTCLSMTTDEHPAWLLLVANTNWVRLTSHRNGVVSHPP